MNESYQMPLPQMRNYPPLLATLAPPMGWEGTGIAMTTSTSISSQEYNVPALNNGGEQNLQLLPMSMAKEPPVQETQPASSNYNNYVGMPSEPISLLELLKRDNEQQQKTLETEEEADQQINAAEHSEAAELVRHRIDCPHENPSFVALRQIYPNRDIASLWDLFVKCNGNIDWTVDILLKEDELSAVLHLNPDVSEHSPSVLEEYECCCSDKSETQQARKLKPNKAQASAGNAKTQPLSPLAASTLVGAKPKRQPRTRAKETQRQMKETIENLFQLSDNQYSEHVRRIRDIRLGKMQADEQLGVEQETSAADMEMEMETETGVEATNAQPNASEECDETEMLKLSFGTHLVQQLSAEFHSDLSLSDLIPKETQHDIDVFIPRQMAKELYMLWVESVYNVLEEQRAQTLREDEDFARLLTMPKYENCHESPPNTQELLSLELARSLQSKEKQQQQQQLQQISKSTSALDLATKLTLQKLYEDFPNITQGTLQNILLASGNNYNEAVDMLNSSLGLTAKTERSEGSGTSRPDTNATHVGSMEPESSQNGKSSSSSSSPVKRQAPVSIEEQKRHAILYFEDTRNMAAHHSRLKSECFRKAKDAMQKGSHSVAVYYSEVARLHMNKIDHYNHLAANCIMDVHKLTTKNPELLDLHYLHLEEAIVCLDIFLDRHITLLQTQSRPYKSVFIITGRGRHSVAGVSTIKAHVKIRIRERCLR